MACSSTLEAELPGSCGVEKRGEMELLKDLPSYDRDNFSRFSQGCWKGTGKPYIRLKNGSEDHAIEIVTDTTSIMLRDFERAVKEDSRATLKRGGWLREDTCRKVPRLDDQDGLVVAPGFSFHD